MNDNLPPGNIVPLITAPPKPLFPLKVSIGKTEVYLNLDGTMTGDAEAFKSTLLALTEKDAGLSAILLWLLLREMTVAPKTGPAALA